MFKKLREGLFSSSSEREKVNQLQSMGFGATDARNALRATEGDLDRAAELLLTSASPPVAAAPAPNDNDDQALQAVLKASLQAEEDRMLQMAQEESRQTHPPVRSAASVRAGQAALERASRATSYGTNRHVATTKPSNHKKPPPPAVSQPLPKTTTTTTTRPLHHHPNVKVPARLQDKSKEEQIVRCADRLKSSSRAVDLLHKALTRIYQHPQTTNYRKIPKTTTGYCQILQPAPGALDLLRALCFEERPTLWILEWPLLDKALLYLGISALEQTQQTLEYQINQQQVQFDADIETLNIGTTDDLDEQAKRQKHAAQCPSRNSSGGAMIQVHIHANCTIRRRFDGDDTLRDVLHWLGSESSRLWQELWETKTWCLADVNRYPLVAMDCHALQDKTLQTIGCWPSGRLQIVPASVVALQLQQQEEAAAGPSRGLGTTV